MNGVLAFALPTLASAWPLLAEIIDDALRRLDLRRRPRREKERENEGHSDRI